MEHQQALAQAKGAQLEPRAVAREGVHTAWPGALFARLGGVLVVLAVVHNQLKAPLVWSFRAARRQVGSLVAVEHALEVAIGAHLASELVRRRRNVAGVLLLVFIGDGVAAVIEAELQQPAEYTQRFAGVADAAGGRATVDVGDVLRRDRAPVDFSRGGLLPALDTREAALHPRSVAAHRECQAFTARRVSVRLPVAVARFAQGRHEVLCIGEHIHVGVRGVFIAWQPA